MNDFKFALRQLLKNPGFTAVAVLGNLAASPPSQSSQSNRGAEMRIIGKTP
jgi:hypothetical protein